MKACILTGGRGEGLRPLTDTRPTSMIEVLGKPVLQYAIESLRDNGIKDICIVTGSKGEQIERYFGIGRSLGVTLEYARQERPIGVEDAILRAYDCLGGEDEIVVVYGDVLVEPGHVSRLLNTHENTAADATIMVTLSGEVRELGLTVLDSSGRVVEIREKPRGEEEMGNYVIAGLYILHSSIISGLKEGSTLEECLNKATRELHVQAAIWEKEWVHLDKPWSILKANRLLLSKIKEKIISVDAVIEENTRIEGPVKIAAGVHVRSGSVIKGPCFIDSGAYIGNNTLIRDNTYIGKNTIIGFGVEVKNSVVYSHVKIGRLSYIGDTVIGESADIGPGTMTINRNMDGSTVKMKVKGRMVDSGLAKLGAFIGDKALITGNVAIYPGIRISAGTTIPPGRIISEDLLSG